jgi:hypothetical protein
MAIAVVAYAESATVAESIAEERHYEVRPDQELIATGAGNLNVAALRRIARLRRDSLPWRWSPYSACSSSACSPGCCSPWRSRSQRS